MFIDYKIYINSNEWIEKRNNFIKSHPLCRACWSNENLTVHHIDYSKLWKEKTKDLMTLCWNCHNELHRQFEERITWILLRHFSLKFFKNKRKSLWINKINIKTKKRTIKKKKLWKNSLRKTR